MTRRTCHGKTEWVDVKWKGGVMSHPVQQDGSSCGVIVVKVSGKKLFSLCEVDIFERWEMV